VLVERNLLRGLRTGGFRFIGSERNLGDANEERRDDEQNGG